MVDIYEKIEKRKTEEKNGEYCLYSSMPVYCETKDCDKCAFYKND